MWCRPVTPDCECALSPSTLLDLDFPVITGMIRLQREQLLLLRHAASCPFAPGTCVISNKCATFKQIWVHLQQCSDVQCSEPTCLSSRYLLDHYNSCDENDCDVCGSVRPLVGTRSSMTMTSKHRQVEVRKKQKRLLFLRHASTCNRERGTCVLEPYCCNMMDLLKHVGDCIDPLCPNKDCQETKSMLDHCFNCESLECEFCGPLRDSSSEIARVGGLARAEFTSATLELETALQGNPSQK